MTNEVTTARQPALVESSGGASAIDPESMKEAESLYRAAEERYELGDVAGALELMQRCFQVSAAPGLLFNLGQLERELSQCPAARRDLTEYLRRVVDGDRREDARAALLELNRECPESPARLDAPVRAPVVSNENHNPSAGPRQYWTLQRSLGWSAVAAGVGAGVGAVSFLLAANNANQEMQQLVNRLRDQSTTQSESWDERGPQLERVRDRDERWATGLAVASGTLVTAGIVLLLVVKDATPSRVPISLSMHPSGAFAGYSSSF